MVKPNNRWQALAEVEARKIAAAHEMGQQLSMLPADPADELEAGGRGRGRRNKGLGAYLVAQGYRDPVHMLAETAGLATELDPFTAALARVEQVNLAIGPLTQGQKVGLFAQIFALQLRASDALMPYLYGKADKPAPAQVAVQVFTAPGQSGDGARVINQAPVQPDAGGMMAPPPMPSRTK